LSASAPDSGLAVSFTSTTPQVCTVSGSTVLTLAADAGPCRITASQGGNATYAPAHAAQSFPVTTGQKEQTITFTLPPEAQHGIPVGEPITLSASAGSGLPVSFTSTTPKMCTVSGSTVLTLATPGCTITASQNGSVIYTAVHSKGQTFKVIQARQAITFDQPPDTKVGDRVPLSASADSGLPVTLTSSAPTVCTVSGTTATTVKAGPCTITASQRGDANYTRAPEVRRSFQVKNGQTITFDQPADAKVKDKVTLSASADSDLPVTLTSSTPSVCTVSGSTATTVKAGTCTITASQGGNDSYAPAADVPRSFQVNPAGRKPGQKSQTITFAQPPPAAVGAPVTLSASATSGLMVSFTSNTPAVCSVSGPTVTTTTAGICMITATQGGNDSYAPAEDVAQSFQVNPTGHKSGRRSQTIAFRPPPEAKAGVPVGEPVTLSASATSDLPVSFTSNTPPVCRVSGSTVTTMATGACTITASQDGSASYTAAPDVRRSFQVNPASSKGSGALVFLLAAATMAAAGVTLAVRRLRLRSHPAPAHAASVRAVPDTGPPAAVSVQDTGTGATHTVRIEPNPGTSSTTIEEAQP
jgi:hypothetical protein